MGEGGSTGPPRRRLPRSVVRRTAPPGTAAAAGLEPGRLPKQRQLDDEPDDAASPDSAPAWNRQDPRLAPDAADEGTAGGLGGTPGTAPGDEPRATAPPATVPPTSGPIPLAIPSARTCRSIDELVEVFGSHGQDALGWCQFDRLPTARFDALAPDELRGLLAAQIASGTAPGVVATLGSQRVGWCSVAPRSQFGRIRTSTSMWSPQTAEEDPDVWSVTCFVVRPGFRRRGVGGTLLAGAIEHARAGGAGWLEGYPVDTHGRKASDTELYRGTLSLFLAAGFEVVARPKAGRAIVRLEL